MSIKHLGELEELIMRVVLNASNDAYGVQIRERLIERTGREPSYGTIYTTLERLEDKGFLKARKGEATQERGGKAKRFYSVTGTGIEVLIAAEDARSAFPLKQGLSIAKPQMI